MHIIGSFVSPYVRKVLAVLELKGLAYTVDPITAFFGNDEFRRLSPLHRIPVLVDGAHVLNDSTVIATYIDEVAPHPPMLPADPAARARARWVEEFADTRLGELAIWGLFYQRTVRGMVWGEGADEARVRRTIEEDLPDALDHVETLAPMDGFLDGSIMLADIALASMMRNAAYAGFAIDPARWPRTAAWVARTLDHPVMEKLRRWEAVQMDATIQGRRQALLDAGAPLSATTMMERTARRGKMRL